MSIALPCIACAEPMQLHLNVGHFEIYRCPTCGLGQTMLPPNFDVSKIYDESYFQGGQADGYADYQGSRNELREEFRQVVRVLESAGHKSGRLLEIGCAYGFFLDEAARSFEVSGVELADHARESCLARGLAVVSSVEHPNVRGAAPYDAVVMLDVIEHLPDPIQILRAVAQMMRPGGRIVLTTGDFGALSARAMGSRWRLMTPPQHLWFFTVDALSLCLEAAGFKVENVSHPSKRVPLSLILYQMGRMAGSRKGWRFNIKGSVPVNLFDAMRIVACRTDT